jgi:hypothetical membrane protein
MMLRWFSLCGIVVPLLDIGIIVFASTHRPGFDPVFDFLSQLGVPGEPYSTLVSAWWMAFPFLFWPFAVAVHAGTHGDPHAWVTPTLLALFALFLGGCGVFHCDPGCVGITLSSKLHSTSSALAALSMAPCPYLLWRTTRHDERWQGYRAFHLTLQTLGLAALFVLILSVVRVVSGRGLLERLFWGLYYVWVVGVAIRLLKLGRLERAAPCHEAEPAAAR